MSKNKNSEKNSVDTNKIKSGIYKHRKSQYVYYDKNSRRGYLIPEDEFRRFSILHNRYLVSISIAILAYSLLKLDPIFAGMIGVAVLGASEFLYRTRVLPGFTVVEKYVVDMDIQKEDDSGKSGLRPNVISIIYCLFALAMLGSLIFYHEDMGMNFAIVGMSLFSLYMAYTTYNKSR